MWLQTLGVAVCVFLLIFVIFGLIDIPIFNRLCTLPSEKTEHTASIDMVISWAGIDNSELAKLRAPYKIGESRYRDNGELKILINSVHTYAEEVIRNVFIILPDTSEVPDWIRGYEKVKLVRESEIFGNTKVFNSHAIETSLDLIPGLSPFFFYSCDDMFFTAHVKLRNWFEGDKYVIPKGDGIPLPIQLYPNRPHEIAWVNNHRALLRRFPGHKTRRPEHVIVMLSREGFARARELYPVEFEQTKISKVRSRDDIHPVGLVLNIDLIEKRAVEHKMKTYHFGVYPNNFGNRLRRNFFILSLREVELASIDDSAGMNKNKAWAQKNLYGSLLKSNYWKWRDNDIISSNDMETQTLAESQ